jgi:hypothetical protein
MTMPMRHFLTAVALLTAALSWSVAHAAPPPVAVVACGQVVPTATTGKLAADLDCTGAEGIQLGARATLDLDGHMLSGDSYDGVLCAGACTVTGGGAISGFKRGVSSAKGAIKVGGGGAIVFTNQISGIVGKRTVQAKGVTFAGHAVEAISAVQTATLEGCTLTDNSTGIASSSTVKLIGTTITGGAIGIYARGASLSYSTIDTTTDGLNGPDILTLGGRPRLKASSCAGKSQKYGGPSWGVCALD